MDKIKIQTGANISKLLQSTVNIPQAFTELVKNSMQNFATFCSIDLLEDSAIITDDGQGFDHIADDSGMNGFEKYFVFGNSYDQTEGKGIRLGAMGIGGKLANDKLAHEDDIHWTIETRNVHGKCFLVTYNPPFGNQFLNDYSPELKEITEEESTIKTETGTKVTVHTLKSWVSKNGWNYKNINKELRTFFGFLVPKLEREGKEFSIYLDGESLEFSYRLPGSNIPIINRSFQYDLYGAEMSANIEFRLSIVYDRKLLEDHPLKNIEIVSNVKVCQFTLSDQDLIEKTIKWLEDKDGKPIEDREKIHSLFGKLVGFVSCDELSSILDSSNMPAKDLSHHGLREDHPITTPFYKKLYEVIIEWMIEYIRLNDEQKISIMDALALEVSSMLAEHFDDEDISDLIDNEDGEEEEEDEEGDDEEKKELRKIAEDALKREWNFDPTEKKEEQKEEKEEKETEFYEEVDDDGDDNDNDNQPPLWGSLRKRKVKKSRTIRYSIIDFGPDEKHLMSRVDEMSAFNVLINSGNPKFKSLSGESSPFVLSLHISELIIREVMLKRDATIGPRDSDEKISDFYEKRYSDIKNKSENGIFKIEENKK